jgi:fused signal recognition particle receptor
VLVVEPEPELVPEPVAPASLRDRLAKARLAFTGAFAGVLGRGAITEESFEDLEEALLRADVGVGVTTELLDGLRQRVAAKEITEPQALLDALEAEMVSRLAGADRSLTFEPGEPGSPNVWMFVGVNGVGKTTTIGKLAYQQVNDGRRVLMAAGDTFRAAAAEQLTTWAERSGAEIVRGAEGGDPSSVIYDGVEAAASRGIDLVMADTAGRLHTKSNLMEELRKVRRVAEKGAGRVTETLLVIDATTGQNGLTQAREFGEATAVTGVVLTKLDGSAKGGIVFAIETELGIPVKLVGLGETIGDLVPFDPAEFVSALVNP